MRAWLRRDAMRSRERGREKRQGVAPRGPPDSPSGPPLGSPADHACAERSQAGSHGARRLAPTTATHGTRERGHSAHFGVEARAERRELPVVADLSPLTVHCGGGQGRKGCTKRTAQPRRGKCGRLRLRNATTLSWQSAVTQRLCEADRYVQKKGGVPFGGKGSNSSSLSRPFSHWMPR